MSDRLTRLTQQRDLIERQLGTAAAYIELEIRGRRVRREQALKELDYLNTQISSLERLAQNSAGPARNRIRLVR